MSSLFLLTVHASMYRLYQSVHLCSKSASSNATGYVRFVVYCPRVLLSSSTAVDIARYWVRLLLNMCG
jgi:hypothetical protein